MLTSSDLCALIVPASPAATKLAMYAVIGAGAGIYLFIRGFGMLRYKRLIENTPSSKICGAAMGLVEVNGAATGTHTIPAGLTGEPCFYYRATVWQMKSAGRNRTWQRVADETLFVPFFVDDATGKALIQPQSAQVDVPRNFHDEISKPFFGRDVPVPQTVQQFLARYGVQTGVPTRLEEHCIKPGAQLFVLGTAAPAPEEPPEAGAGDPQSVFLDPPETIRAAAPVKPVAASMWASVSMDEGLPARSVKPAAAAEPAAGRESGMQTSGIAQAVNPSAAPRPLAQSGFGGMRPRTGARETETQPGALAAMTAPRGPGAEPQPRIAVEKGPGKTPFMISSHSRKEIEQKLGWQSVACIWGGPALTLACLIYLCSCFGW